MVELNVTVGVVKLLFGVRSSSAQCLDLAIAPKNLSADMEVSQVWDTTQMQHRAIFVWAHLGSLD